MTNPRPLILEDPLDIEEARQATRALAHQRRAAETELKKLTTKAAEAERDYRKALSEAFAHLAGDGTTAAQREADARAKVAHKSYERDVSAGMVKWQAEVLRGLEGERSQLKSLIDWSARINEETRERYGREAGVA